MIEFDDKKYGEVVIYEDIDWQGYDPDISLLTLLHRRSDIHKVMHADIVGFRKREKNYVKLLKNRIGPLEDYETEMFILNYKIEEEIFDPEETFDPVESRFEILDL